MNVEVENLPNCITTLRVEVPPDQVSKTWDSVAKDYTQYAKIPGYRPGKAPRNVVENKYKKQIREEVEKKLLSESCREAINEKKLRVISLADVQDVEFGDDKTMRFTATLVTAPEFELPDYKGIPVRLRPVEVTEKEIDDSLETLREQQAEFADITDRALALEDFAVIDYAGTIDGKPVSEVAPKAGKPLSANTDFWIRLTPEAFFPGFADHLVGAKAGESRTFDIDVPADFAVKELAGHKITYAVTVKALKQRNLPELNDAFAAKLIEGKTLADVRDLIKIDIEKQKLADQDRDKKNQIMGALLSKVECELPADLARYETKRILGDIVREQQARGVPDETLKEGQKELVEAATRAARERLRGNFILLRIAELENIKVTKEEFNQRIEFMAMRYQTTREKLLKELSDRDALDQINEEILRGKTLDFLASNVSVQAT
jgi:trigger factor